MKCVPGWLILDDVEAAAGGPRELAPGTMLDGKYRIESLIAVGGMGAVYLGTHTALGVAKAKGARFLLASTSEIYGDPLVHPQTEDYHCQKYNRYNEGWWFFLCLKDPI